ncbi:MAG: MGMT family protein [Candidatus Woesearchaeota archaeon]|nr:MGMT family protein [Candidatus Woesearchaeota archaeon]
MLTHFQKKVYFITRKIPKGRVTTYGEIARAMRTKGCRAVGNALHRNPFPIIVPCHRVVKSDGSIGGFASGARNKIKLLRKEGVKIRNGRIITFEKKLFKFKR